MTNLQFFCLKHYFVRGSVSIWEQLPTKIMLGQTLVLMQMIFLNNVRKVGRLVLSRTSCYYLSDYHLLRNPASYCWLVGWLVNLRSISRYIPRGYERIPNTAVSMTGSTKVCKLSILKLSSVRPTS
jgi:hypothetical protein